MKAGDDEKIEGRSMGSPSAWQSWIKSPAAMMFAAVAGLAALLINSNAILSNARSLPTEARKTIDQFRSWYNDDAGWSGRWTSRPEGYVDSEDMGLGDEPIVVDLEVKNGAIDGTILTTGICETIPIVDFLLLRGNVRGSDRAKVVAWDIIGGRKQDFAELDLSVSDGTMTVVPRAGLKNLFPPRSTLTVDPTKLSPNDAVCKRSALIQGRELR